MVAGWCEKGRRVGSAAVARLLCSGGAGPGGSARPQAVKEMKGGGKKVTLTTLNAR